MSTEDDFYTWTGPRPVVEVLGRRLQSPAFHHRIDSFQSVHLAEHDAVTAALPTDELHPVQWFDGRAAVLVWALRYHEVTALDVTDGGAGQMARLAPYAEVGVSALVTRRPARRGLPMVRPLMPGVGGFVLHLPVTTGEADEVGRTIFGFPKFVADMDFVEEPSHRGVTVSEAGREILRLDVRPRGPVVPDHRDVLAYSVRGTELMETTIRSRGHGQPGLGRRSGLLRLGDHPVAEDLGRLGIDPEPQRTMSHVDLRLILPWSHPVGSARPYPGYLGAARSRARLTVAYPGTGPLEQLTLPAQRLPEPLSAVGRQYG
jgi:hypothetical protein